MDSLTFVLLLLGSVLIPITILIGHEIGNVMRRKRSDRNH